MSSVSFTSSKTHLRRSSTAALALPAPLLRRAFFILSFLFCLSISAYLYFLVETVRTVATREAMEQQIVAKSSALGAREAEYLRLSRLLTLEEANARGLYAEGTPLVIHLSRDGRLSMDTSAGR